MDFTDDQKSSHYRKLVDAVKHIRSGQRITEDWMYGQMYFINLCRAYFPDMTKLNSEVVDPRWRKMAESCEIMISQLVFEIKETRSFSVPIYCSFCDTMKKMFEMVLTDDELSQLMGDMVI